MTSKYEYIGPDGALVNNAIEADRESAKKNLRGTPDRTLEGRLVDGIKGEFTAKEQVKAIGILEAREHEGRKV